MGLRCRGGSIKGLRDIAGMDVEVGKRRRKVLLICFSNSERLNVSI